MGREIVSSAAATSDAPAGQSRYGSPSWTETETDRPAPEATERALGILARWLVRAAQDQPAATSGTPAQKPQTSRHLPPAPREKRLDSLL